MKNTWTHTVYSIFMNLREWRRCKVSIRYSMKTQMRFIFPFIKPSHSKLRPAISYQLSSSIPHSEEKRKIWIWTINNRHSKNKIGKLWSMSLNMVTYSFDLAKGVQKISLFIHIHERSYWIIRTCKSPVPKYTPTSEWKVWLNCNTIEV